MAADSMHAFVLILPNPVYSTPKHLQEISRVKSNLTFGIDINTNIRTLYTADAARGDDISGLLYVPWLPKSDPCSNISALPSKVTRKADLPQSNFRLIGFAPWVSQNCSLSFLEAAQHDPGNIDSFVFYTTDTSGNLPGGDDSLWKISFKKFGFPVYAISGKDGVPLMQKVSEYSGNMSDVWEARNLTSYYNATDYARVYLEVDTGERNLIPTLWLFLLAVLAALLVLAGLTSISMHVLQYRHRQVLRRRVANGEVDLEALGIKRLKVPRRIVEGFPIRLYTPDPSSPTRFSHQCDSSEPGPPKTPTKPTRIFCAPSPPLPPDPSYFSAPVPPLPLQPPATHSPTSTPHRGYSQSSCSICLDDFIPYTTTVRELPCLHVFHPGCIDPFLENQSSLCPLCKTSALPRGYVPPTLTNTTVRRERNLRRIRARAAATAAGESLGIWERLRASITRTRPEVRTTMEMSDRRGRRRLSRRGGSFRAGLPRRGARDAPTQEGGDAQVRGLPKWRRTVGWLFPGFR